MPEKKAEEKLDALLWYEWAINADYSSPFETQEEWKDAYETRDALYKEIVALLTRQEV